MNCLNAAYSSPQTDTKLILNLKISIKIYLYYSNEVLGGFFFFLSFSLQRDFWLLGVFLNANTQVKGKLKNLQRSNFQVSAVLEEPHSVAQSYPTLATLWTAACQASLSFTISWSLFKLMSIELMIPCKHLILCHPLLLPSIFPSTKIFTSLVQSIGASASVLTMDIQG